MFRIYSQTTRILVGTIQVGIVVASHVATANSIVHFDVSQTAAAAPSPDHEFEQAHHGERLVTIRLDITAIAQAGQAKAIEELRYSIYAPEQNVSVVDFSPKTMLTTDVVGNIQVQDSMNDGKRIQLSVDGAASHLLRADANGGREKSQSTSKSFEMLPPKNIVSAAGTIHRGHGVYYKLLASDQHSLEGSRQFLIKLRVSQHWRGDYLRAACFATDQRGLTIGKSSFLIPIYDQDDLVAKRLARQLSHQEQRLLTEASNRRGEIRRARYPTVAHELSLAKPKIPADWLVRVLTAKAGTSPHSFERILPPRISSEVTEYRRILYTLTNLPPDASKLLAASRRSVMAEIGDNSRSEATPNESKPTVTLKPITQ